MGISLLGAVLARRGGAVPWGDLVYLLLRDTTEGNHFPLLLPKENAHVARRFGFALAPATAARRPRGRTAALAALLPQPGATGPAGAAACAAAGHRRGRRGAGRLRQLLSQRRTRRLPAAARPQRPVANPGGHYRSQGQPCATRRGPAETWRAGTSCCPGGGPGRPAAAGLQPRADAGDGRADDRGVRP